MQQITERKEWIDAWSALGRSLEDAVALMELGEEAADESMGAEVTTEIDRIEQGIADLEFRNMLSGEDDERNALLTIHAGAGGTEAQDWGQMLLRMYLRWCERRGFTISLNYVSEGAEAGIMSAEVII